jgi:HEPN domain-containing protein
MRPELAEVRRWLTKARHDWTAVRRILTPDCVEFDVAAFHCQQAVEKTLKAYLVWREISFEKIHDLGRLLDCCAEVEPGLEALRDTIEPLTVYAVAFRYPGPADPGRDDVEHALAAVERAWTLVTSHLPRETIPD